MIKNFLNPEGHQNPITGSKVKAILLKRWIWPIGGASLGRVCACSLRSRLFLEICVRRMIVYTACNPINFLRAPFSLKEPPNLLEYYKLDSKKSENMKIRPLPDWSGSCLIKIRLGLIKIRQLPDLSGHCLIKIRQPPDRSSSHHGKIRKLPAWSGSCQIEIRQLPDWNQAAAWSIRTPVRKKSNHYNRSYVVKFLALHLFIHNMTQKCLLNSLKFH